MIGNSDAYVTSLSPATSKSGVSWSAIFAGAVATAALSLILLMLGFGLGFSAVSPWPGEGVSATGLGVSAIIWLTVTQVLASGMGGYLTGRLRVRWATMHGDEVYFRDTAHGFLAWAVAALVSSILVASSVTAVVGGGVEAGANVASGTLSGLGTAAGGAAANSGGGSSGYFIDSLLRTDHPANVSDNAARGVVTRIFTRSLTTGQLSSEDRSYLGQLVAQRTDLSQAQAEQRVDQVFAQTRQAIEEAKLAAKKAADTAAKVAAWSTLWVFITLLIGAFCASLAATFGGRRRDAVTYTESVPTRTATPLPH